MQDIDSASDQRREGPPATQRSTRRGVAALRLPPMRMEDSCCVVMWEAEPTRAYHTWVNTPAEQLLGFPMSHWQTEQNFWAQRLHPEDRVRVSHAFHQAIRDQGGCEHTYRMLHADGSVRWIQEQVKIVDLPLGEGGPTPKRLRGTMIDVTEYRREIDALERSRAFYRSLFEDAPALYFVLDDEGVVKQVNQRGARELGYERSSLLDTCFSRLQTGTEAIDITHLLDAEDGPQEWHTALRRANGSPLPVRLRALKGELLDNEGEPLDAGSLLVACDPTSQPVLREAHPAPSTDAITGVLKRAEFERRLQHLLYRHYGRAGDHALAVLDIDLFSLVNYRLGQRAGDALLCEVAELLPDNLRPGDLIGRSGSDEFALLLENCSLSQARAICESAVDTISHHEFEWAGQTIRLTASVGLVKINADAQSVSELMSAADTARRQAAADQRAGIRIVDTAARRSNPLDNDVALAAELQNALEGGRLQLFYQPIRQLYDDKGGVTLPTLGAPRHYELLLRLRRDNMLLGPQRILMAAERHHLVSEVDRWVLTQATEWLERRANTAVANEMCCINISAKSICDRYFVDFARSRLRALGARAASICFEITETAMIANLDDAVSGMERLRATGCEFSLDDFGSGSASFPYLRKLPVQYLKIDGTFVRDAGSNDEDAKFLDLINQIGHHAGKQTVAEFVENERTLARVQDIGLDFAQGYQIGHPRPIEDFGASTTDPAPVPLQSAVITPFPSSRSN